MPEGIKGEDREDFVSGTTRGNLSLCDLSESLMFHKLSEKQRRSSDLFLRVPLVRVKSTPTGPQDQTQTLACPYNGV